MGLPGFSVRRADPEADEGRIVAALARDFGRAAWPGRHEWLYLANPAGRARVWLAEEGATGRVVGVAVGYPRRMRANGVEVEALNLGDFAMDAQYRSLGPALELLQTSLEPVRRGDFAFAYDHPTEGMLALYRRMSATQIGRMQRWVRPLTLRPFLDRRWGHGTASAALGSAAGLVLRMRDALIRAPRGIDVDLLEGDFTPEFDDLDGRTRGAVLVEGVRSAAYLNWRYRKNVMWRHEVFCARRSGTLLGYAVARLDAAESVTLAEMAPIQDSKVHKALLVAALALARERGAAVLVTHGLTDSPVTRVFRDLGFIPRPTAASSVCCLLSSSGALGELLGRGASWWMIEGDRHEGWY